MNLNGHEVRKASLEVDGVDPTDYPDFCDAYFCYAEYTNGIPLTDDELEQLEDILALLADLQSEWSWKRGSGPAKNDYDMERIDVAMKAISEELQKPCYNV